MNQYLKIQCLKNSQTSQATSLWISSVSAYLTANVYMIVFYQLNYFAFFWVSLISTATIIIQQDYIARSALFQDRTLYTHVCISQISTLGYTKLEKLVWGKSR